MLSPFRLNYKKVKNKKVGPRSLALGDTNKGCSRIEESFITPISSVHPVKKKQSINSPTYKNI